MIGMALVTNCIHVGQRKLKKFAVKLAEKIQNSTKPVFVSEAIELVDDENEILYSDE